MGQKTILLAEDDPAHAALIRRAFERVQSVGSRLDVVGTGAEVIDYLFATGAYAARSPAPLPDLLLLDLKMPEMDGLQVLQVLRRVRGDDQPRLPPVVILTSSIAEIDVVDAYRLGVHSFVRKPTDFRGLVDAMRQIVAYWLDLNQSPAAGRQNAPFDRDRVGPPDFLDTKSCAGVIRQP